VRALAEAGTQPYVRLPAATVARPRAALTALRACHNAQSCWAAGHLAT
jgi:hypothetical protein